MSENSPGGRRRGFVFWVVCIAIVAGVVHGFIYWKTGAIDPCRAAALRTMKATQPGEQRISFTRVGSHTALILPGGEEEMTTIAFRSKGFHACYIAALTGKAFDLAPQ
jgi:hypothetical protein